MHTLVSTVNAIASTSVSQTNKMIAENIFLDLKSYGLRDKDIITISSEILNRLTIDIKERHREVSALEMVQHS